MDFKIGTYKTQHATYSLVVDRDGAFYWVTDGSKTRNKILGTTPVSSISNWLFIKGTLFEYSQDFVGLDHET